MRIGLLDYGGGNLRSVHNAILALGHQPAVLSSPEGLDRITHLILPGQGEFGDVMAQLGRRDLISPLREWISAGKPYFGICVGYQILFEGSDEAPGIDGLGIVKGRCIRFSDAPGKKIPQMGWNSAIPQAGASRFWKGLGGEPYFYFVHSYFPVPEDSSWSPSVCDYAGERFAASVEKGDVLACQFHPEKSQDAGLALIRNFLTAG
ncbi:imidazole glycerol phosphate synthase subunit HisH [Akkermansiaceae bacterium]|nr:imidazole glycerol phosphate synthase subunit HisH [Akkermansiaceae bacterium]